MSGSSAADTEADEAMDQDEANTGGDVEMEFIGNLEVQGDLGHLEPSVDDVVSEILLAQLGSLGRHYRREARQSAKALVSEVYSPPRITEMIQKSRSRHLAPGLALDITVKDAYDGQPWDFSLKHKRDRARALISEQRPFILIGSPMCTHFCTWQALNIVKSKDKQAMERARVAAEVHLKFVAELYQMQMDNGLYFLHEHPMFATSWSIQEMKEIAQRPGVQRVRGDQCQFGAEIKVGKYTGDPIMKPSGFLTNSPALVRVLDVRCAGMGGQCSRPEGGTHRLCSDPMRLRQRSTPSSCARQYFEESGISSVKTGNSRTAATEYRCPMRISRLRPTYVDQHKGTVGDSGMISLVKCCVTVLCTKPEPRSWRTSTLRAYG